MEEEKFFYCDKCGKIESTLLDGNQITDRFLEGIFFEFKIIDGSVRPSFMEWQKAFTIQINEDYWLEKAKNIFTKIDFLTCPKCKGDVDNPFFGC